MRRAENQSRFRINANTVGCSGQVGFGDGHQDFPKCPAAAGVVQKPVFAFGPDQIVAGRKKPEGGIGGVPVGGIITADHVRKGSPMFELSELDEHIPGFIDESGGDHAPHHDQGVTPPVQKPGKTGDHGFESSAVDNVLPQCGFQSFGKADFLRIVEGGPDFFAHSAVCLSRRSCFGGRDAGGQLHFVAAGQGNGEISGAEQIRVRVQSAFGFQSAVNHVLPLGFGMKRTAGYPDFETVHGVGMENETVRHGGDAGGKLGLQSQICLGGLVKIPVFDIRAENDLDGPVIRQG